MVFSIPKVYGRNHLPLMDQTIRQMCHEKSFFIFHLNSMKIGEVLVHIR